MSNALQRDDVRLGLLAAAKLIRDEGWIRNSFHIAGHGRCVWGAVLATCSLRAMHEVGQRLRAMFPGNDHKAVVLWNDLECQSAEEAARFLERAAGVK